MFLRPLSLEFRTLWFAEPQALKADVTSTLPTSMATMPLG